MVKLAAVDFCETVASFQTLDPFLEYVLKKERPAVCGVLCNKLVKRLLGLLNRLLFRLGYRHYLRKKLMVAAMKDVPVKSLDVYGKEYYVSWVRPCLIQETLRLIRQLREDGYRTVIVSGGSQFYIQYFAEEYGMDGVMSAEIEVRDGRCTGRLLRECLGKEKVEMLDAYIRANGLTVSELTCITDSQSDLPLLSRCGRKIIVSHNIDKEWVTQDMEELIWG